MKLFYAPGACSIGIHLILEEIDQPYEAHKLDLKAGEQRQPPFSAINPKGKVPTLQRDDGFVLTEFPIIALWLGLKHGLLPKNEDAALHAAETMEFCVSTIHGKDFARFFAPGNFTKNEAEHDAVRAEGRNMVAKSFGFVSQALGDRPYIGGDTFSVADAAMFYVEFWSAKRANIPLPANIQAHFDRVMARPATVRTLAAEGLGS